MEFDSDGLAELGYDDVSGVVSRMGFLKPKDRNLLEILDETAKEDFEYTVEKEQELLGFCRKFNERLKESYIRT